MGTAVSERIKGDFDFFYGRDFGRTSTCQIESLDLAEEFGLRRDVGFPEREVETGTGGGSHRLLGALKAGRRPGFLADWYDEPLIPLAAAPGRSIFEPWSDPGSLRILPRVGSGATGVLAC